MASIIISTTIPAELHEKAKRANLKWSHALRFGIIKLLKIEEGEDLKETNTDINELRKEIQRMQLTMSRHIDARVKLMADVERLKDEKR